MPFPLLIPFAVATTKVATNYAALYWGGGLIVAVAVGLFYRFLQFAPSVSLLKPSATPLHATKEKITQALRECRKIQSDLALLDLQAKEELEKAKIAYAELTNLFTSLSNGLLDACALADIITKISQIMGEDARLIEVLKQKMASFDETLSITQPYSFFFTSAESKQHQFELQVIVGQIADGGDKLDEMVHGFNP